MNLNLKKNISLSPPKYIDAGEAEAIDLALHLKADYLLIDERKGTILANQLGIKTIGILGILIVARKTKLLSNLKNSLDQLIENKFWISIKLYHQILQSVNEHQS